MAINIDPAHPIRRPADQRRLIEAVRDALAEDEGNWIEWKSTLPLSEPAGRFKVAKNILGMANRHPDQAARFCAGLGYVIVGAQPGKIPGVAQLDPAKLDDSLRPYLGLNGPEWSPTWISFAETNVLILTVEAPRWGDPIHLLRKSYQPETGKGADNGAIFVRRKGSTTVADADEIDMLQDRARRRPDADLSVSLDWLGQPLVLTPIDLNSKAHEQWIETERNRLLEPLRRHQEKQRQERPSNPMAGLHNYQHAHLMAAAMASAGLDFQRENRTSEGYTQEVEDYLAKCHDRLMGACFSALVNQSKNRTRLSLNNLTALNLPDVELTLRLPGPIMAFDEVPNYNLPESPRLFGRPRPNPNLPGLAVLPLATQAALRPPPRLAAVEIQHGDSAAIRLRVGNLRPHQQAALPEFHLVVPQRSEHEILGTWEATSTGVDAVAHGEFRISIADRGFKLLDLLPPETRDEQA